MKKKINLKARLLVKGKVYGFGLRKGQYLNCFLYDFEDDTVKAYLRGGCSMWFKKKDILFVNEKNRGYKNQDIEIILNKHLKNLEG
jgi:hypothetical protein